MFDNYFVQYIIIIVRVCLNLVIIGEWQEGINFEQVIKCGKCIKIRFLVFFYLVVNSVFCDWFVFFVFNIYVIQCGGYFFVFNVMIVSIVCCFCGFFEDVVNFYFVIYNFIFYFMNYGGRLIWWVCGG